MTDRLYFIWYSLLCGIGSAEGVALLERFDGNVRAIYEADEAELLSVRGFDKPFLRRFTDKSTEAAKNIVEACFINDIRILACVDPDYPVRLKALQSRPLVLYARGRIERLSERLCVGIVGTRAMSDYGKHAAFDITRVLCAHDAVVVSGAAYGIDSVANQTAVYFKSDTIAVLGSGVNVPYPKENARLLDSIAERGLVLSEYAPGTPPSGRNFPIRNRIISGLSDALLVVEADSRSGSLITASLAERQERAVYAVPGSIYSHVSRGTNALIANGGAKLCTDAQSILRDFRGDFKLELREEFKSNEDYIRYELRSRARSDFARKPGKKAEPSGEARSESVARANLESKSESKPESKIEAKPESKIEVKPESKPKPKPEARPEPKPEQSPKASALLEKLDPLSRRVLDAFPGADAISPDKLTRSGLSASDVLSSLTMLELCGAVESLPGGMFKRLI